MDIIKGYKINFSLQACMYLFTISHSMPLTKPRKGEKKRESTLTQIEKNRKNKINDRKKKQKKQVK